MELIDPHYLLEILPSLLTYLPETIRLSLWSMVFAMILALPLVLFQLQKVPVLGKLASAYVLLTRSCPLVVQIYVVYFGIPVIFLALQRHGFDVTTAGLKPALLGVIAMSLHFGAYISQVLRAALLSVDPGQMEAAQAVGMSWFQGFRRIVLPQALCYALPPLCSQFLSIIKSSSILFVISVQELMAGGVIEAAVTYRYLEVYIVVAAIYWVVCFVVEKILGVVSTRSMVFVKG